jgi:glycerophosphoryl diester phosphodiesterase
MQDRPGPLIIGHRGAPGYRPEHTSGAYDLAFSLGADAVEPDIVATRDGVLVLRHENEISTTTDIADHSEFADRRTTKTVDGAELTGWFTEDFTWAELSTLRAVERVPSIRQPSSTFDGMYPLMRLTDLLELVNRRSGEEARLLGVVAELKHATYFSSIGFPLHELFLSELRNAGWLHHPGLVVESFEKTVLGELYRGGYRGKRVYLVENKGAPADRIAEYGETAADYASDVSEVGLYGLASAGLAERVEGISVHLSMLPNPPKRLKPGEENSDAERGDGDSATENGEAGPGDSADGDLIERAHAAGLSVYCWTLRPENRYLPKRMRRGSDPASFGDWQRRFTRVMRTGVDAVFADHPDLAVVARDRIAELNGY